MELKNFVGIFDNAFSSEYCKKVIDFFEKSKEAGFALDRQAREGMPKTAKDDTSIFLSDYDRLKLKSSGDLCVEFNDVLWNKCYPQYAEHYQILKIASSHTNYDIKLQKTEIGQGYHVWHFESDSKKSAERLLVYSLYLNDVEEGGETEFLYMPMRVKPKEGTMLIWPAGFTHTHRGNPPISNTKYIITGWIEY